MKKIITLILFTLSPITWATHSILQVSITNSLATDCHLLSDAILFGHISDHTKIPQDISSNQTVKFKMRQGPKRRSGLYVEESILLTYQCDAGQKITLFSSANMGQVDAKIFDLQNMWATYTKKDYQMKSTAKINWLLQ